MTLTIALIGFGARVGLAREIASAPTDAAVTIICDLDDASRERAAAEYPNATVVASIADVISAAPDAAMVLTPDDTHAAVAIPLLEAGIAVFCEKPLAIALDDADAILEAAYRSGSRLYVGHNMRHMPVISHMRQLITEGAIGEVKAVWCRHFVGHGATTPSLARRVAWRILAIQRGVPSRCGTSVTAAQRNPTSSSSFLKCLTLAMTEQTPSSSLSS